MIASASITLTNLSDGLTTFYQYAKNTSNTSPPTTGWSAAMPSSEPNKFIWRREASAISLEDISEWGNVVCLTGSTGAKGDKGDQGTDAIYVVPQNGNLFRFDDHLRSHKGVSPTTESGGTLFPDGGLFGGAVGIMESAIWLNIANSTWEDLA